jgi:hypothetical protein
MYGFRVVECANIIETLEKMAWTEFGCAFEFHVFKKVGDAPELRGFMNGTNVK